MDAYLLRSTPSTRRSHSPQGKHLRVRSTATTPVRAAGWSCSPRGLLSNLLVLSVLVSFLLSLLFPTPSLVQIGQAAPRATRAPEHHPQVQSFAPPGQAATSALQLHLIREQKALAFQREKLLLAQAASALQSASSRESASSSCDASSHPSVVKRGDTLSGIAVAAGTTWMALASFNHLTDPNLLLVNQVLCLPGSEAPAAPASPTSVIPTAPSISDPSMNLLIAQARQDAINAGISPYYFVRQINQESRFNPNVVSPAGAIGIAQFMPGTAASHGINPWDPTQALQGGAHLMASYVNQYGGNYAMALAAYNAGTGAVQYATSVCGANWRQCLPAETQNYIAVILGG